EFFSAFCFLPSVFMPTPAVAAALFFVLLAGMLVFVLVRRAVRTAIRLTLLGILFLILLAGAAVLWWNTSRSNDSAPQNTRPSNARPSRAR
ncbi:MAG: hypothetical protein ACRD68_12660, partial [Pyrinomonadaceae bacterium]